MSEVGGDGRAGEWGGEVEEDGKDQVSLRRHETRRALPVTNLCDDTLR